MTGNPEIQDTKHMIMVWLQAVRAFSFTATIIPVLLGGIYAQYHNIEVDWRLLPLVLLFTLSLNAAADLINDYHDHMKGVDKKHSLGSSHVIFQGSLRPEQLLHASQWLFFIGGMLSMYLIVLRGPVMLAIVLGGMVGAYTYTGSRFAYKYYALGEVMVFILMGPLLSFCSFLALTGSFDTNIMLASLPLGFLVTAILNGNNLRDIHFDTRAKIRTIPMLLGIDKAKLLYSSLILFAYLSLFALIQLELVPLLSLMTFLTTPIAATLIQLTYGNDKKKLASIDVRTALLHLTFGTLYIVSFMSRSI